MNGDQEIRAFLKAVSKEDERKGRKLLDAFMDTFRQREQEEQEPSVDSGPSPIRTVNEPERRVFRLGNPIFVNDPEDVKERGTSPKGIFSSRSHGIFRNQNPAEESEETRNPLFPPPDDEEDSPAVKPRR